MAKKENASGIEITLSPEEAFELMVLLRRRIEDDERWIALTNRDSRLHSYASSRSEILGRVLDKLTRSDSHDSL